MDTQKVYSIAAHYRSCELWEGSSMTHARMVTHTCTPDKKLGKRARHKIIAAWLFKNFGIPGPEFNPTR